MTQKHKNLFSLQKNTKTYPFFMIFQFNGKKQKI